VGLLADVGFVVAVGFVVEVGLLVAVGFVRTVGAAEGDKAEKVGLKVAVGALLLPKQTNWTDSFSIVSHLL